MKSADDRKSYRKIVLNRTQIRELFNIPSHIEIASASVENDPFSISFNLVSDYDRMPWKEFFIFGLNEKHSQEEIEDAESMILPYKEWERWPSQ